MDLKNLKRQEVWLLICYFQGRFEIDANHQMQPWFFSVDTMFYFLFMIHDLHGHARHTLQLKY